MSDGGELDGSRHFSSAKYSMNHRANSHVHCSNKCGVKTEDIHLSKLYFQGLEFM